MSLGLAIASSSDDLAEAGPSVMEGLKSGMRGLPPALQPIGLLSVRSLCYDDASC